MDAYGSSTKPRFQAIYEEPSQLQSPSQPALMMDKLVPIKPKNLSPFMNQVNQKDRRSVSVEGFKLGSNARRINNV